jgi:hypothetical protein
MKESATVVATTTFDDVAVGSLPFVGDIHCLFYFRSILTKASRELYRNFESTRFPVVSQSVTGSRRLNSDASLDYIAKNFKNLRNSKS